MHATDVLRSGTAVRSEPRCGAVETTAALLFEALQGLHRLETRDAEILSRSADGLRLIRWSGARWTADQERFRISLANLPEHDAVVVEAAACFAADLVACDTRSWSSAGSNARRALWLAALLRVAESLSSGAGGAPEGIYAVWTGDMLYVELDGTGLNARQLDRAGSKAAGLEALTGRRVIIGSSAIRRGSPVRSTSGFHKHLTTV